MADERIIGTKVTFDGEAEYKQAVKNINKEIKVLNSEMKLVTAEYKANGASLDTLKNKQKTLEKIYEQQSSKIKETEKALEQVRIEYGKNSDEAKKYETILNYQKTALVKTEGELKKTAEEMEKTGKAADKMGDKVETSGKQADESGKKFQGLGNTLKKVGGAIGVTMAAAAATATAAVTALTKSAIENYAEYEQLVGGVETLFKTSSNEVKKYSENAYKTAGLSANAYMESVTSFSASLLQSLDGDTSAAAKKADQAITDMADNANKMGSSMKDIQNAYQGFAKQNYTMLDNLKLGFGGTKEEMQRLLDTASQISGMEYDISSYADIVDAIHVVQTEMGITGTTAQEASSTIQGSIASMGAAWTNFLTGMADSGSDFDELLGGLIDSVITVANNIIPKIIETVPRIIKGVGQVVSTIAKHLPKMINKLIPVVTKGVDTLLKAITKKLPEAISTIASFVPMIISGILDQLPAVLDCGVQIVLELIRGLTETVPDLLIEIVNIAIGLADTLIQNIPLILEAAIQFFMAIVDALPTIIEALINALPGLVQTIVDALINSLPILLEAAITLLMAIVDAIPIIIEELVNALPTIINAIIGGLLSALPMILDASITLLMAIVDALPTIITALIEALPQVLMTIINTYETWFPKVLETAVILFAKLVEAIPTLIIKLVESMPQIIYTIVSTMKSWLPQLAASALSMVTTIIGEIAQLPSKIWNAIIGAVKMMADWTSKLKTEAVYGIKRVTSGILDEFKSLLSPITNIGKNLVEGLWKGISGAKNWIQNKIKGFCDGIVGGIKGIFGINSPSRVMRDQVGVYLAQGIGVGFTSGMKGVNRMINDSIPTEFDIRPKVTMGASMYEENSYRDRTEHSTGFVVNQYIYANETDYAEQQRLAQRNFKAIARTV